MKKVIYGEDLKIKMSEAIDLLCNTVKVTLGPKGNNIIIDHSNFSPFITNDGVTIAENIESEDEVINTILELAKEASIKTNENVGDGTTTTLVLLQSIFNEGMKLIESGVNPIILKKELDDSLKKVISLINDKSIIPRKKDYVNIATVSSNDEEIGSIISKAFLEIKNKDAIRIKETDKNVTTLKFKKGYFFETELASPYFLRNKNEINLKNCKVLIMNDKITDINELGFILNEIIDKNMNLIIFANYYDETLINQVISLNLENNSNIYLLKIPEYGYRQYNILKDLHAISNAHILENDIPILNNLGEFKEIKIREKLSCIVFDMSDKIKFRIKEIEKEKEHLKNNLELEYLNRTLSMFSTSIATINVAATTITERREKKMRFDDALCAVNIASNGILPGGGLTLLEIGNNLNENNNGNKILKKALEEPIKQILINSGLNYNNIIKEIKEKNYTIVFNTKTEKFENIKNTSILDPTQVVINSLNNACSIASMLLTSSSIIINEYKNNYNRINDFNEL